MKKTLLTFILAGSALGAQAQYNRSLFYQDGGGGIYQSAMIPEEENLRVFSCAGSKDDTLHLSWTTINSLGDVTASQKIVFPNAGINTRTYLSGAFEESDDTYLIVMFTIDGGSQIQRPVYLRVNTATQQIVNSFFPTDDFKQGFCTTIRNGNELVTALVGATTGLSRISFLPSGFSAISTELIDVTQATALNIMASSRKQSEIVVFNGSEYVLFGANASATLYKRTAPNTWSSLNVGADGKQIDLVTNDNNQLVAFAGTTYTVVNNSLASVASGTLVGPAIFSNSPSECVFHDGRYFRMTCGTLSSSYILEYDNAFSLDNTVSNPNSTRFDGALSHNGNVYMMGDCTNSSFNHLVDAGGQTIDVNRVSFFARAINPGQYTPFTEYGQLFQQNDVHVNLGQGNVYFAIRPGGLPSAKYNDSISLAYYAAGLFAGKTDSEETVGLSPDGYFETDMLAGPYTNPADYSLEQNAKYNRGFYVTHQMIEAHFDSLVSGSTTYIAPHGIREWPAHGNTTIGQAEDLAPFWDRNNDGLYDPYAGDYPKIYGDQCFYTISHQNSAREVSANVELHTYFYSYDCSDIDTAYHNTIFIKQHYLPKAFALDSFYVGSYLDLDLGNYSDDYNGTHAELGLVYSYNGDLMDENMGGQTGFGTPVPAEGFMILKGSKVATDGIDNTAGVGPNKSVNGFGFGDGTADNEYYGLESSFVISGQGAAAYSDPSNLDQLTNMLRGYHRFGDPHYYGVPGSGATTIAAKYDYPGDSDPLHYGTNGVDPGFTCSEYDPAGNGSTSNPSGDRRMMAGTGMSMLEVGDTLTYDLVYLCVLDNTASAITDAPEKLMDVALSIRNSFDAQSGPCGIDFGYTVVDSDLSTETVLKDPFVLYPNPTNGLIAINGFEAGSYLVTVYDVNGRLLESREMDNQHNQLSLATYSGSLFLVHITNGSQTAVKRVVKQ